VLTAHNATDNLETVLLHLVRGGGGNAMCGIPPLRHLAADGCDLLLARPLLCLTAEEILSAVKEAEIPYVTDSTNGDTAYRRNLLRKEVLPYLRDCNAAAERNALRLTENMREDMLYLDRMAEEAFENARSLSGLSASALSTMARPISYRVIRRLHGDGFPASPLPERVHIDALLARLDEEGDFSLSFPGDLRAVREGDTLFFCEKNVFALAPQALKAGENVLSDGGRLYVMEKDSTPLPQNVYTLSIQATTASATIEDGLWVRSKEDGDAYRTRGMRRRLKKLFSDAGIPPRLRPHFPVITDSEGILCALPFGVRDDRKGEDLRIFYAPPQALTAEMSLYFKRKK
ncbi:MAG: tRNA lysidine(34) synthetase TilS, partial [Clostridia bacterium]|nr:tRNA lysidine(34) synthetase TilS [Clostridia bacterium]